MPRHLGPDEWLTTPMHIEGDEVTMSVWANWEDGPGPLIKTADDAWAFPYDHDGSCAFRAGGEGQVTSMPVSAVKGRWAYYALAADEHGATLWIDDRPVETWNSSPTSPQTANLLLMKDAVGTAAYFAVFERRLRDDELHEHWSAGIADPEIPS